MSRLAYAIARNRPDLSSPGETARLAFGGLAIIHGPAPADAPSPGLATLEGFASTIDALHARETVLPLRFGSLHDTEAGLEAVLQAGLDQWRSLLDEVEGCDEMGLRVLLDGPEATPVDTGPTSPGLAYLAARRAELAAKDALTAEAGRVEALIVRALEGLHRRRVVEGPGPGRVPRGYEGPPRRCPGADAPDRPLASLPFRLARPSSGNWIIIQVQDKLRFVSWCRYTLA